MTETNVLTVNRGLLIAESEALKAKLSDVEVWDPRNPATTKQRADVWFGFPVAERERRYPYITIDFVGMEFAYDRAHSAALVPIDYWPSEYATFDEYAEAYGFTNWVGEAQVGRVAAIEWHPYNLVYQITTHARHRWHHMQMMGRLVGTSYLPDRWGYLDVRADNSTRWLDRISMFDNSTLEGSTDSADRVFSTVYTVNVSAHVPPELPHVYLQVLQVAGTLGFLPDPSDPVAASWTHPDH